MHLIKWYDEVYAGLCVPSCTERPRDLVHAILQIRNWCEVGLVTVTVYGYDRTMYGNHTGTARIVWPRTGMIWRR
jgi:hypothetical protein